MNLTNKQIKTLKSIAASTNHKYQVGKGGVDINVINLLDKALKAHELIKISFNKETIDDITNFSNIIISKTNSILINKIGHTIVLYRPNLNKKDHIVI